MIDELVAWGFSPPLVTLDAVYGECTPFRLGLTGRDVPYVAAVKPDTSVHREEITPALTDYTGRGPRSHSVRYHDAPVSVKDLAGQRGRTSRTSPGGTARRPRGEPGRGQDRTVRRPARPAGQPQHVPGRHTGALPVEWLIIEWPEAAGEPTDYGLSTLPDDTPLNGLVRLAKIRWRIEHDYRELKHGLGVDHFEGRIWLGRHHHATLVTAAHLFVTTLRRAAGPKAPG